MIQRAITAKHDYWFIKGKENPMKMREKERKRYLQLQQMRAKELIQYYGCWVFGLLDLVEISKAREAGMGSSILLLLGKAKGITHP